MNIKKLIKKDASNVPAEVQKKLELLVAVASQQLGDFVNGEFSPLMGSATEPITIYRVNRDLTQSEVDDLVKLAERQGFAKDKVVEGKLQLTFKAEQVKDSLGLYDDWEFPQPGEDISVVLEDEDIKPTNINLHGNEDGSFTVTVACGEKQVKSEYVADPINGYFHDWVLDLVFKVQDCDFTQIPECQSSYLAEQPGCCCYHEGNKVCVEGDDGTEDNQFIVVFNPQGNVCKSVVQGQIPVLALPAEGSTLTTVAAQQFIADLFKGYGCQDSIDFKFSYRKRVKDAEETWETAIKAAQELKSKGNCKFSGIEYTMATAKEIVVTGSKGNVNEVVSIKNDQENILPLVLYQIASKFK